MTYQPDHADGLVTSRDNMIVERGRGRDVLIRYRDEQRQRQTLTINNYFPYCFVPDIGEDKYLFKSEGGYLYASHNDYGVLKTERGYTGLYGEPLVKVITSQPYHIGEISKAGPTWEANIPYVNRVLSDRFKDTGRSIANYDHRIWYLDCEWNPDTNAMRLICVYDNFTGEKYAWGLHKDYEGGSTLEQDDYTARFFDSEREMLGDFITLMKEHDPDILTGWYVTQADVKTIIERCRVNEINATHMSPLRRLRYEYGDWQQPIVGRLCIDLMLAFSKLWELKNGKLPGYSLNDVAKFCLGDEKVELKDGHDTYYTDLPLYLSYCMQDTMLLSRLDELVNSIEYYLAVQHLVQCDFRATPFVTKVFSILCLRDENFTLRIPTKPQFDKVDYEGAEIMEPVVGVHDSIGIFDIKAMYHSNAAKHNICWTTLDPEGEDCGNGTKFSQENKGLLVRQMDRMTALRNHYKKLMKDDPSNSDRWDTMQYACKSLVASMYGVAGDAKYSFYHPEVAAAITFTSRRTLNSLKEIAEERGSKVIYGHTDSVFCSVSSPEVGQRLVASINAEMAPIEVEFEKWCSRLLLKEKNRYAASVSWPESQVYIKGIELRQSRMPEIMKSVMKMVIESALNGEEEEKVTGEICTLIESVMNGDIPIESLCIKGQLKRDIDKYKVLSGPSAGAAWANEFLGKGYRKGSFFLTTINDNGKYIAFDSPSEIKGIQNIGYRILAERFIVKKIEPYYDMMGWSKQPIENALNGLGGTVWI